ncbi:MAG: Asp-tRNA(Asn)/Glu-tRNA(Gln) amidotransferase subunit GatC [Patescibacteria group bacterium]
MDIDQIKHLAKLSHLAFTDEELARFARELSSILAHVSELERVDLSGATPTAHAVSAHNVFRKDEYEQHPRAAERAAALLDAAPEQENGYVKVKAIL